MKLYVLSDLHLESDRTWRFPDCVGDFDVAVAAGDIDGPARVSVQRLATEPVLAGKPVVLVAGNHEHYQTVFQDNVADGLTVAEGTNVAFLHRSATVIGDVRFLGVTLWTDYAITGMTKTSMVVAGAFMQDHRSIEYREGDGEPVEFTPWHAREEHRRDVRFLKSELAIPHVGPTVIVTHHLPSAHSISSQYATSALNPAFASDLDDIIASSGAALWIHGHTHTSCDYQLGGTRVICNPKGYGPARHYAQENPRFDPALIIEI